MVLLCEMQVCALMPHYVTDVLRLKYASKSLDHIRKQRSA